jgi:hypothetical protein
LVLKTIVSMTKTIVSIVINIVSAVVKIALDYLTTKHTKFSFREFRVFRG